MALGQNEDLGDPRFKSILFSINHPIIGLPHFDHPSVILGPARVSVTYCLQLKQASQFCPRCPERSGNEICMSRTWQKKLECSFELRHSHPMSEHTQTSTQTDHSMCNIYICTHTHIYIHVYCDLYIPMPRMTSTSTLECPFSRRVGSGEHRCGQGGLIRPLSHCVLVAGSTILDRGVLAVFSGKKGSSPADTCAKCP